MKDAPANGDFASYLTQLDTARPPAAMPAAAVPDANDTQGDVTPFDFSSGDPSAETLEHTAALMTPSNLSDDELERQALSHPGADGDATTPE
jgi:hypothetical protein